MEFDGLKIGGGENKPPKKKEIPVDPSDYIVEGANSGQEILSQVKSVYELNPETVIYGEYNNADKPFLVRANDFLIDHSRVTLKDKSYFFHMLAVMTDAGIPVVSAVKSLAHRAENPRFRRILNTIAHNCEHGFNLADAMRRFDDVFDEAEIGIVKSGEATGRLDKMLFKLSAELDKTHDLSMKLWGAAVYPIAVLAVLILVATGMLVWVFPTLLNLLTESGVSAENLPFATRVLMWMQNAVTGYWWLILAGLAAGYGVFKTYVKSDYGAVRWDYLKLRIPVVGTLLKKLYTLRFVSILGLLITAGLPVIKALQITGNALSNKLYKLKTQEVIEAVRSGEKISGSLQDTQFLFPPEVTQMLRVGESSASLGKVSEKIADQYQREIDNTLKKLSSVFEPIMILFVGLFVALLALAIMAPIFNLSTTLST